MAPPAAAPGPTLAVRLLGELELRRAGGTPVPLPPSRRTRALLGYLVATGAPQLRSALCDLLWDGPDDPRAALRWSLTKLRPVVDGDGTPRLHADRDKVAFAPHDCEVDTTTVLASLDGGRAVAQAPLETLEQAASALHGEFLDGLELPGCYRFHHWCMAERERFARLRRAVLDALVGRLEHDPQRALPHARAMVTADPLVEAAHARLVETLAAAGAYPDAERHYAWARELLRREVALPDGGALDAAVRAVRRRQREALAMSLSAPAEAEPEAPAPPAAAPPEHPVPARREMPAAAALVGRDAECRRVDRLLAAPAGAPVLLFAGEPGIGKTRLLDHLSERAVADGRRLIRARCFEAESVRPYGWWLDALRGVPTEGIEAGVLDGAAPLLGARGAAAPSREQLFDTAAELLATLARRQPLVLVVDDLQWIDAPSAALLHFVARRLGEAALPLALAAGARAGEVDDNAAAKGLLQSWSRERALERVDLAPLDADAVRAWLGDRLVDLDAALHDSGGNPLMLTELARAGDGPARSLDALLERRLAAFDDAARDLLGWAAAFGGTFDAQRLAAATSLPVAEVLGRIGPFERRGLLRATGDGGFDFAHGLVRQAVYRALSTPRRRALHGQIARAFEAASGADPWLHGAVVHHAGLAGDAPLAARAALAAGQHWLRMFANVEAAQVAERGLALLEGLGAQPEQIRLEIGLLRLRVAAAAAPGGARLPDLAARIGRAIDAACAHALHADAAAGWELLAYCRQQAGDAAGAHAATLEAERWTRRADAVTHCQQLANSGRCLFEIEADPERGRALLADAARLADEIGLPVMELEWGRGLVARAEGDRAAAARALERAVALARHAANHWREYECMLALATVEFELERFDDVLRHADEVGAAARRMGEARVPYAEALVALARRGRGDAAATAALDDSLAALRARDDKAHLAYVLNVAAAQALADGDAAAAERGAAEALAAATAVRRPSEIARAQATLAAAAPVHARRRT
jgi:DNA-binding SARP family transcriptional activator